MHDPLTQCFRLPGLTVWHKDPEKRGDDDSCDWFGGDRPLNEREQAIVEACWDLETLLDNRPHYPDSREHKAFQALKVAMYEWRKRSKWRIPVRWHVWYWRLQIHPLQTFKRWAFSRCCRCGKGFSWGYCPISNSWHGTGPLWFRSEKHVEHFDCSNPGAQVVAEQGVQ